MSFDLNTAFQEVSSSLKNLQQMLVLIEDLLRSTNFMATLKGNEYHKPSNKGSTSEPSVLSTLYEREQTQLSSSCNSTKDFSAELFAWELPIHFFGLSLQGFSTFNLSFSSRSDPKSLLKDYEPERRVATGSENSHLSSIDPNVNFANKPKPKQSVYVCNCRNFKGDDELPEAFSASNNHFMGFSLLDLSNLFPCNGSTPSKNWMSRAYATEEKHAIPFCNCKDVPLLKAEMSASLIPASVTQSRLDETQGRKRKRVYLPCNCGQIGDEPRKRWMPIAFDRLRLGVRLQEFIESRKGAMIKRVLGFARVQGEPGVLEAATIEEVHGGPSSEGSTSEGNRSLKAAINRFNVKLPNIDKLKPSHLATSLVELMERVPQIGKTSQEYPDKKKLFSVQDFFKYTEAEGKKLFEELDRDKDGQITLEDLEIAMKKRRLPQNYARDFLQRTRNHWFKKSVGWSEFLSLMEQKEPMMLRAFNSLSVSKSGTLQKGQVLTLLQNAGLPATEGNAAAMMRFLDADTEGIITYGQFRNFLLLLPSERLGDDPRMVWFEAATVVPMAPPVEIPAGNVLKSALAGGLACALSTTLMYPLDTVKTRVQASTISFSGVLSKLPEVGVRGLYRGSIPAILGQFSSHGLRTGIFEASKLLLINMVPTVSELQVQSIASFCSTVLGTAIRIPCEVLKQRLQAGLYQNVGEACIGTFQQDGLKGFFRGTGVTLCREVPFYVAGMGIYEEAKKGGLYEFVAQSRLNTLRPVMRNHCTRLIQLYKSLLIASLHPGKPSLLVEYLEA
ncbi:hypothetical protein O6H91_17G018300 [Diphasiastrum complanatum]|uniref:Uncharacterized protein n=1 Tax=Diphasiastrum complanatum TaxID=34168 RepID=A0ACC2B4L5_DIPCM|nr:hypothetical protein O6H91_17G018300 [Diphasiastrum complanatum]